MNLKLLPIEITLIGMCAALMVIFSQFSVPLPFTSVPITFQIFGLVLISIIVGAKIATISQIIFILLGSIGLPVFANFSGGFSIILGPTGGYIFGFIFMAFLVGRASNNQNTVMLFITSYIGLCIDYIIGTLQLKIVTGISLKASLIVGVYPFVGKDIIILSIAILLGLKVRKKVKGRFIRNVIA